MHAYSESFLKCTLLCCQFLYCCVVATVSFSSATYQFGESAGDVQIIVTRSGNIKTTAVVLVASDTFQGTAAGSNS